MFDTPNNQVRNACIVHIYLSQAQQTHLKNGRLACRSVLNLDLKPDFRRRS